MEGNASVYQVYICLIPIFSNCCGIRYSCGTIFVSLHQQQYRQQPQLLRADGDDAGFSRVKAIEPNGLCCHLKRFFGIAVHMLDMAYQKRPDFSSNCNCGGLRFRCGEMIFYKIILTTPALSSTSLGSIVMFAMFVSWQQPYVQQQQLLLLTPGGWPLRGVSGGKVGCAPRAAIRRPLRSLKEADRTKF